MASLTSCMAKAGVALGKGDREALLALSREHRAGGAKVTEAGRKAIQQHLADVRELSAEMGRDQPRPDKEVTTRASEKLKDFGAASKRYAKLPDAKGGKVLNTDVARELSVDYSADRTRSAPVHEPSSAFIKQLYAQKLKEDPKPGELPVVLFTAGGTGAGKTTAIDQLPQTAGIAKTAQIIYDTNMNKLDSAQQKIEQALAAGKVVRIVMVAREPVDALVHGALTRAERQRAEFGTGRTVPVEEHIRTHTGAVETVNKLAELYKDDPRVQIKVVDNSLGKGAAVEKPIEWLKGVKYNDVERQVKAALEAEREAGRISDETYQGFAGTADARATAEAGGVRPETGPGVRQGAESGRQGQVTDERTGAAPPKPGEPFIVYRVGSSGKLENRNAGNSDAVGLFLGRLDDFDAPQPSGAEKSNVITAYRVTVDKPFGPYELGSAGSSLKEKTVGRESDRFQGISYSFPEGGGWKAEEIGRIGIDELRVQAKAATGYEGFDEMGGALAAQSLRDAFPKDIKSATGNRGTFDPNDPSILAQGDRGSFTPETNVIALFKGADLSTFLHESGHYFLETYADVATRSGAPLMLRKDVDTLLAYAGHKGDIESWRALSLEERRAGHEKIARGFEAYLFEGRAPTAELRTMFARFRSWLLQVYRSISNIPDAQITPEVREVFDRMLASEDAIREAEQQRKYEPLFKSAADAGMTEKQFEDYQAIGQQASDAALDSMQSRSMRDMKWLSGAKGKALKDLQRRAEAERKVITEEVTKEIQADPAFSAAEMLRAQHGADQEVVAEMHGFDSADHMLQAIRDAGNMADVIKATVDQRMLRRHGDLTDPKAVEDAANEAVHNEARARFLATGLKILTKSPLPVHSIAAAAKKIAETTIAGKRIRDLDPQTHLRAESKANREALAAAAKDPAKAIEAQRAAVLSNRLARAALDAKAEVEKGLSYLKKAEAAKIDPEYSGQIDTLLQRFELGGTLKRAAQMESLRDWVEREREAGHDPNISPELLAESNRKHYKAMTVEEFRGLVDTVKQIEHLGRLKQKLLIAKDKRSFDAHMDELAATLVAGAGSRTAKDWDIREARTKGERTLKVIQEFGSDHIKINSRLNVFDGATGGSWWTLLGRTANEAANWKAEQLSKATVTAEANLRPIIKGGKAQSRKVDGYTLENIFSMGLNMGNAGNRQRMASGNKITPEKALGYLSLLSSAQLQKLNDVWAHVGSYKEQVREQALRSTGREPEWVESMPFKVTGSDGVVVDLTGGYFPVKYDRFANATAARHAAAEEAKGLMQKAYTATQTNRSFEKPRADEVHDRALSLSLQTYFSGVQEVIHDLAWRDWVSDASRTMRDPRIDAAVRQHYGAHTVEAMNDWIAAIATNDNAMRVGGSDVADFFRHNASFAGLAFNTMTAAIQPLGIVQSAEVVGYKWIGKSVAAYIAHPIAATRKAKEMSALMRDRDNSMFRELAELNSQIEGQGPMKKFMRDYGYWLIAKMQSTVDVPTFHGAYEKAIADPANRTADGMPDEAKAVALAEQAVIDAQGSGRMNDLSAVQRGNSYKKLFTVFYNFNNLALNIGYVKAKNTSGTAAGIAGVAVSALLLTAGQNMLVQLMRDTLTPGDSGNYDDPEKIAKIFGKAAVAGVMSVFMGVRELTDAMNLALNFEEKFRGYEGPAGVRVISDATKLAHQISQGEFDDAFRKAMINLAGSALGLPSAAANKLWTGVQAIAEGKTQNPAALPLGYQESH